MSRCCTACCMTYCSLVFAPAIFNVPFWCNLLRNCCRLSIWSKPRFVVQPIYDKSTTDWRKWNLCLGRGLESRQHNKLQNSAERRPPPAASSRRHAPLLDWQKARKRRRSTLIATIRRAIVIYVPRGQKRATHTSRGLVWSGECKRERELGSLNHAGMQRGICQSFRCCRTDTSLCMHCGGVRG